MKQEDIELANSQISSKRLQLDEALCEMHGVQFFFSCITALSSNANHAKSATAEVPLHVFPGVAYFIAYRETETCNETTIFSTLHNRDVDPVIKAIRSRRSTRTNQASEHAAKELFQVLKDHNNPLIINMLNASNTYCCNDSALASTASDVDTPMENSRPVERPYPTTPCRLVIVNNREFGEKVHNVAASLRSDGLMLELDTPEKVDIQPPCLSSTTGDVTATIRKIERLMKVCDHALYRSHVYAKPAKATVTYSKMMDVKSYLHKLLANEPLRESIIKHFQLLEHILSHPACEVIQQLKFELDLIEVSNGYCFTVSGRKFIPCPILECDVGNTSPRCFIPYDHTTPPEPKFFKEGILNSFPDIEARVNFLNKLYQCLMAGKMPHKVRKLVVCGPRDSGKTSWACIFHRIINADNIASITSERQFSASMINDDTELVFLDEWSANTLASDMAKTIFQGGWMVSAIKHGKPKCIMNNSPYYITTNGIPNFGDDEESVQRRLAIFSTTSLSQVIPGVDRWIYDHAMDCVAWMASQITAHRDFVEVEELWYEDENRQLTIHPSEEGAHLWKRSRVSEITSNDISVNADEATTCSQQPIHRRFTTASRRRCLERRRYEHRALISTVEENQYRRKSLQGTQQPGQDSQSSDDGMSLAYAQPLLARLRTKPRKQLIRSPCTRETSDGTEEECLGNHTGESAVAPCGVRNECKASDEENHPVGKSDVNAASAGVRDECEDTDVSVDVRHDREDPTVGAPFPIQLPSSNEENNIPVCSCSQWTLNSQQYFAKVNDIVRYDFIDTKTVSRATVYTFNQRVKRAKLRKDKKDRDFWSEADPRIDAWMLVFGEKRDVFDLENFVVRYPDVLAHIQRARKMANVRVMQDACPVFREFVKRRREDPDTDGESYWWKIKKWRPW